MTATAIHLEEQQVLVIDDDPAFGEAVFEWIRELGYRASLVPTVNEGVEALATGMFSAVLLDLRLPGQGGLTLLRRLNRSDNPVPVIMMSGDADPDELIRMMRERAVDFLKKPFSLDDLEGALARALSRAFAVQRSASPTLAPSPSSDPSVAPPPVAAPPLAPAQHAAPSPPTTTPASRRETAAVDATSTPQTRPPAPPSKTTAAEEPKTTLSATPPPPRNTAVRPFLGTLTRKIKSGEVQVPILDPEIARLQEYLTRDDFPMQEVVDVVTRDPGLTASLLRKANSAYFARGKPVEGVPDACSHLGVTRVVALAFELVVQAQVTDDGPYRSLLEGMWRNSVATSRLADRLGKLLGRRDGAFLQVAGLLHNLGEALCVRLLSQLGTTGRRVLERPYETVTPIHEQIGELVATTWKLSPALGQVIGHHHEAPAAPQHGHERVRLIILGAWRLALQAGFTYFPHHPELDETDPLIALGLQGRPEIQGLLDEATAWDL